MSEIEIHELTGDMRGKYVKLEHYHQLEHIIASYKAGDKARVKEIDRLRVKAEKWDKVVDLRGPMSNSASDYCSADFFNDFEDIFQEVDEKGGGDE